MTTPKGMQGLFRNRVLQRLRALRAGAIAFVENDVRTVAGSADGALGTVEVHVRDAAFWPAVALRGALGAGESFVDGDWAADDPARLVRLLLRDRQVLDGVDGGIARLIVPVLRLGHALRRNSRRGSRRNIAAHYDLGDEFFAAFLDPTMTYSSAVFEDARTDLESAQRAKLRRLCTKLALEEGDELLEIGTGWGSMAVTAAGEYGARVTTTTISRRQFAAATARVREHGLSGRVNVLERDYRDLQGAYDKLVSVEMVEAVGHHYLPGWFGRCSALLRPGGAFAMQAITIADQHYESALRRVDFIKRHVFPGSFIPSITALLQAATQGSDLRLVHLEDFGLHYAETLRRWRERLVHNAAAIRAAGHPERLLRAWQWYLAYCEGGFAERYLSVAQLVFTRPGSPHAVPALLPAVAADPYAPGPRLWSPDGARLARVR